MDPQKEVLDFMTEICNALLDSQERLANEVKDYKKLLLEVSQDHTLGKLKVDCFFCGECLWCRIRDRLLGG